MTTKQKIIQNLCYTELVYTRINKKLAIDLSKAQIESFMEEILKKTGEKFYIKTGKNYYVTNYYCLRKKQINSFLFFLPSSRAGFTPRRDKRINR